jgi:ADP-heptose:LPS heptosyltransferase
MTPTEEILQNLADFERLKRQGSLTGEAALVLSTRASELVIAHFQRGRGLLREAIELLCRIATDGDSQVARAGIIGIFPELIERLNDSFDPAYCQLYDRLFAQLIEFCRRLPEAKRLDEGLTRFGLRSEDDLLARKFRIRDAEFGIRSWESFAKVRKVLLPSRVTIGADVAVTSVMIAKLRHILPQAKFIILGSRKLRELYGGDDRIQVHALVYERGGNLLARLASWLDVVQAVNEERQGLSDDEVWLIDPDSRLTQLGLLPLIENDHNYYFFESRSYQGDNKSKSIGQLAAHWIGEVIGNRESAYPFVSLPEEHRDFGQCIANRLRAKTTHNLVAVSFGVGGNQGKRLSDEFEEQLIRYLLADSKLILDKGASDEERGQINGLVTAIRAQGKNVVEINEANKNEITESDLYLADAVTWDGSIGAFAGLISASDQYIGYDSAGQHLAAAMSVQALTVFVNSNNAAFAERWRPYGKGVIQVVNVDVGMPGIR